MIHDVIVTPTSRVLLIYTGGTIGMIEDPATGALKAFDFTYIQEHIPELKRMGFEISSIQFDPPLDSAAITIDLWKQLAQTIDENYDKFDGFVVLHGTDTMAYSASALSFLLRGIGKPVVFTGSQLPVGRLRTDGKENLITALQIAANRKPDGSPIVPEVCIFFDKYLMRANRTFKCSTDQFEAFASNNYPYLAYAGIHIRYNKKYIAQCPQEEECKLQVATELDPHVCVLKLFPGITPEVVKTTLSIPTLKGVVLESYGSGNAPSDKWFLNALEEAVQRGIVIVNVTQCTNGGVEMTRYDTGMQLSQVGVVSGYDMTTESALTKMMYLFGLGLPASEVSTLMQQSLCGELTHE